MKPPPSGSLKCMAAVAAACLAVAPAIHAQTSPATPGCEGLDARACLQLSIKAMGGRDRLDAVTGAEIQGLGHTLLMEQSYRQAPFLSSYQRFHEWLDFAGQRLRTEQSLTWPQAGGTNPTEIQVTIVVTPDGGDYLAGGHSVPLPASMHVAAETQLQLDPVRLLQTAQAARDLRYAAPERLHGTLHAVLAFNYQGRPLHMLLDAVTHLPDAIEQTRTFDDFWYAWGDVHQRIYFDNWILVDGVSYPSTRIEERNGAVWRSTQALKVVFNPTADGARFAVHHPRAKSGAASVRWEQPFSARNHVALAPHVDLYQGAWNATVIRQDDGVVVLEAPISGVYTRGILDQAKAMYPRLPIKAVLTTSDSWPHVAGVREAVAAGLPVYALDLNVPLLKRLVAARHSLRPDTLQQHPRTPQWRVVSGRTVIGNGADRIELYPLRGADTGRQYMVYFPASQLLYASDTLVIDPQTHALYQPELMHEVMQAVAREHLQVRTVYAMHQGPTPWSLVEKLVRAAMQPAPSGPAGAP